MQKEENLQKKKKEVNNNYEYPQLEIYNPLDKKKMLCKSH